MITRKEAEKAKASLKTQIGNAEWFKGITLGLGSNGVSIRVAVTEVTDYIRVCVPPSIDGVEVILEQAIVSTPFDERILT